MTLSLSSLCDQR